MNFLYKKKPAPEPTISIPIARDICIVGHIWPADNVNYRDLRFHIHGKSGLLEVDVIRDVLLKYEKTVEINQSTNHIKCIAEAALIPLIQRKLSDLGLKIRWIIVNP
jgi:hypothetical protein